MELINKFYLEDGHITNINGYAEELEEGKIIYEVIRIIEGIPLFEEEHIYRMEKSFKKLNKGFPYEYIKIKEFIARLISANNIINGNIKITYNLKYDSIKIYSIKHSYPHKELYNTGVKTILYNCERDDPNIKLVNDNFRKDIDNELNKKNAFEAILINKDGNVTEGSKSNIFFIKNDTLITSETEDVLPGITRDKIIELSKLLKIQFQEREINKSEINDMDAIFISGTSPKILPICKVDDIDIPVNNLVMTTLIEEYDKLINKYLEKKRVKSQVSKSIE